MRGYDGRNTERFCQDFGRVGNNEFRMAVNQFHMMGFQEFEDFCFMRETDKMIGTQTERNGRRAQNAGIIVFDAVFQLGSIHRDHDYVVPHFTQNGPQLHDHGNHAVFCGGIAIRKQSDIHGRSIPHLRDFAKLNLSGYGLERAGNSRPRRIGSWKSACIVV